jgi:hypothetical protein
MAPNVLEREFEASVSLMRREVTSKQGHQMATNDIPTDQISDAQTAICETVVSLLSVACIFTLVSIVRTRSVRLTRQILF